MITKTECELVCVRLVCVRLRTENFVASRTYMNDKRLALKNNKLDTSETVARFSETAAVSLDI
jgi:hypothetical protein